MCARDLLHIVVYEMKMQSRTLVFRLLVLFSLVSIVMCHLYWQGQGNCVNWKMVALPCSMPLVNAYLFGVVQSLFLIVMMARIPRRMNRPGYLEAVDARPYNNETYYWGTIFGNLLLFLFLNLVVILVSIFVVNLTSLAPIGWRYYLFYLFTLNLPAWMFVAGITLWICSVTKSHFLAITLPVIWWIGCVFWLPYWQHGILDYFASGVPNLFSEVVGHLSFTRYVLHRLMYLLMGTGLLVWSVSLMKRLPNDTRMRKGYVLRGLLPVMIGMSCGVYLEYSYYKDRQFRVECRDSFARNWNEKTCRISDHAIALVQSGNELMMCSDMTIYNPGKEALGQIVLFLNPGLHVRRIYSGDENLEYRRDKQVVLIDRILEAGDSLRLQVDYAGRVDDRFCDLHLSDTVYEDAFHHDRFFATGRQGAFVEKDLLVLTPACVWYPMALPPVNPLIPMMTGRDFTRFRLRVDHPLQKVVVSQGQLVERGDSITFECPNLLNGISLCGANYGRFSMPIDDVFSLQLNSMNWGKELARKFSKMSRAAFISTWSTIGDMSGKKYRTMSWYTPKSPYLYLLEVPVSFRLDSHTGKLENGLVEPGMIFLRERGFDMDIVEMMDVNQSKDKDDLFEAVRTLYGNIFGSERKPKDSHPLTGIGRKNSDNMWERLINDNSGASLWNAQRVWVHSLKFPFMGKVFNDLFLQDFDMARGVVKAFDFLRLKEMYDYLLGHSLMDILKNDKRYIFREKLDDLWMRLTLKIPSQELRSCLDSLYKGCCGEIDYDSLIENWTMRWNVEVGDVVKDWVITTHEQYFKVKDAKCYYDPETRYSKVEGKVMNAGNCGGVVFIEYGSLMRIQRSVCYLKAGEAKAFTLVTEDGIVCINTGLSTNRPTVFYFQRGDTEKISTSWEIGEEWHSIPVSEFMEDENSKEFIVDDQDVSFELKDGELTWLQNWRQKPLSLVSNIQMGGTTDRWKRVMDAEAYGDSIRGFCYISGDRGESTATWSLNVPQSGRYRVMGKVYRLICTRGAMSPSAGIVYYYTVSCGNQKQEVEINLDIELPGQYDHSCWASLGVFDFQAGEVSVTLSNKEVQGRKEVPIVADAVKFVKLE